ncbi:MAG: glycosyltransferase family 2 protein [Acidobacteriota bacterium]
MFIVHTFQGIFFLLFGMPLLYLAFLTGAALFQKRRSRNAAAEPETRCLRKFLFLVPAHNEASSIRTTLRSLASVDYPRHLFERVVIADNCTDATAALAREEGARVMERTDAAQRGKGHALRWAFERLLGASSAADFDALIVIDADTIVSGNYLAMLNVAIESGAHVMQTSDLAAPSRTGSWTAEALRLSFVLHNYVRPLGRKAMGLSAGLKGNGMCFTRQAMEHVPWRAFSKAEDLEYGLQMLLAGYAPVFVPGACALAVMPEEASNAESQRARWEGGRLPVIRRYARVLLSAALLRRSWVLGDAFIDLVMPAFVTMMAGSITLALLSLLAWASGGSQSLLWWTIAWSAAMLSGILHVSGGVKVSEDPSLARTLSTIPQYVWWKAKLYLKLARQERSGEWVRTAREMEER